RFYNPQGITADHAGNLYVADYGNHTIRRISPDGVVTTVAGSAGQSGHSDGFGSAARFNLPSGLVVDAAGNIIVTDTTNYLIRKISPGGAVTTIAGTTVPGAIDATGQNARFFNPCSVTIDADGNFYVVDANMIRKVTADGRTSSIAGGALAPGSSDG